MLLAMRETEKGRGRGKCTSPNTVGVVLVRQANVVRISQNVLDNIPINGLEPTNSKHPVRLDSCGDGVGVGVGDADTLYLLVCGTTVPVLCGLVGEHRHSTSPCCGIHSHTGSTTSTASINCNRVAANYATDCCCGLWLCTLNGYLSGQWRVGVLCNGYPCTMSTSHTRMVCTTDPCKPVPM